MSKVISAGVLLEHNGKFLIGHPTELTGTTNGWGILKGKIDDGEHLLDAALREFHEESNLDIASLIFKGLGVHISPRPFFRYDVKGKKLVYVFWALDTIGNTFKHKFSCPSLIDGTDKPEIDKYEWVNVDTAIDKVVESQKELFRTVKELTKHK